MWPSFRLELEKYFVLGTKMQKKKKRGGDAKTDTPKQGQQDSVSVSCFDVPVFLCF